MGIRGVPVGSLPLMRDVHETGTFIIYRGQQLGSQSQITAKKAEKFRCRHTPLIPEFGMKRWVDLLKISGQPGPHNEL